MLAQDMQLSRGAVSTLQESLRRARLRAMLSGTAAVLTLLFLAAAGAAVLGFTQAQKGAGGALVAYHGVLRVAAAGLAFLAIAACAWAVYGCTPSRNDRLVMRLRRWVHDAIDPLEDELRACSDDDLRSRTNTFRQRLADGEPAEAIRAEAYAVVREASRRAREHRQFTCQMIGSLVLENCNIAEMKTGEGKTIVCYGAVYMNVLLGRKVHIVTHSDYHVKRDAEFARPIFELLGVSVGYIQSDMDTMGEERRQQYACDITYGTNNEFGFDYLRDNMKLQAEDQVQGLLDYAVIDEVDSILIDEARTPLIISGPAHDDVSQYRVADAIALKLIQRQNHSNAEMLRKIKDARQLATLREEARAAGVMEGVFNEAVEKFRHDPFWLSDKQAEAIGHTHYFIVERDRKSVHMADAGSQLAQEEAGVGSFYEGANINWPHFIDNALRAHLVYERDKDYVVQDGQVIIVDEFTGRLMHGRQWSEGLHQAVEGKEKVTVKEETQTLATITLQNFFKLYGFLAGMTGTAMTESEEFMKIYRLEVVAIPTNRPVNRSDHTDALYYALAEKDNSVVNEIHEMQRRGQAGSPFILMDVLHALLPLVEDEGLAERIRKALDDARDCEEFEEELVERLREAYDEATADFPGGRPILVGTTSVEKSEKLSQMLTRKYGIEHEVLNARQIAREAEIVAKAGHRTEPTKGKDRRPLGNVTISTNMAGRGTDIRLQEGVVYPKCIGEMGRFEPGVTATRCCIFCDLYDPETNCANCFKPKIDPRFPAMGRTVCRLSPPCGLHVIGTERHEARRIDDQLCGRSGRQGDPGSSRFFLSLEDDLIRLFIGQRMTSVLNMLGFRSGMPIEDRRLTKAIKRAQKHVEERNFGIRKHLLEYDEVMDYQRREYYGLRQRVLEGKDLVELIWEMIDEAIDDALDRFLSPEYPRNCAAEWCRTVLDVPMDAGKLSTDDFDSLEASIRDLARDEMQQTVRRSLGEYVDPSMEPSEWDLRGLAKWAERFGSKLSQNQLRKMDPVDIEQHLIEAADERIDQTDLSAARQFVDPLFGRTRMTDWLRTKFEIDVPVDQIAEAAANTVAQTVRDRVRESYRRREYSYPVHETLQRALAEGPLENAYVAEQITAWARTKYNVDWTVEQVQKRKGEDLERELIELSEECFTNGRLEREVDRALQTHEGDGLTEWAKGRFGRLVNEQALTEGDAKTELIRAGRELVRFELTRLERYVLLRTLDTQWKDHMYEMDLLKSSIGLRGYAERDPRIEYKREGTRMFQEMMQRTRERVTDDILKVQMVSSAGVQSAYRGAETRHDAATGAGFAGATADQQAAMARQGEGARPQTIRRTQPKVGRNDPCPCGSGKKYKNCCGRAKQ